MSNPEFEDETPTDVFNFWEGANFKLKIRKVDGYSNYDKSEFITPAPLFEDDSEMERVWGEEHSLDEFVKENNFKTYDELKIRQDTVLGNIQTAAMTAPSTIDHDDLPFEGGVSILPKTSNTEGEVTNDENLDYFKKLAEA